MRALLSVAVRAAAITLVFPCHAARSSNLFLGNPSFAGTADQDNLLVIKPAFALSYNSSNGEPNWVSWTLVKGDVGDTLPKAEFEEDTALPAGVTRITSRDYDDCGFDRGHMCPPADRSVTKTDSDSTFVMTNILPQSPELHRNAWNQEEIYLRGLADAGSRLHIIAGPAGEGGEGSRGLATSIANGQVNVPAYCWKIAVVEPDTGKDDIQEITAAARVIATMMPNDTTPGLEWGQYRTTVARIELKTGLHFFGALPDDVARALETKIDTAALPPPVEPEWHQHSKAGAKPDDSAG